jgi:hypothetical protein
MKATDEAIAVPPCQIYRIHIREELPSRTHILVGQYVQSSGSSFSEEEGGDWLLQTTRNLSTPAFLVSLLLYKVHARVHDLSS